MNMVTPRGPMGLKNSRPPDDPEYLKRVRGLPCVICEAFGERQNSPTEAHHPIHGRYGTRKVPDRLCIPLCHGHHIGDFDTSKIALHREPQAWKEAYGEDHEYVAVTQDRLGV